VLVALAGLLGATVSAITESQRADLSSRIPETASTLRFTALRLLIGPTSAILFLIIAKSSLYEQMIRLPRPDGHLMFLIAFAAGFAAERVVARAVELIAGKG